MFSLKNHLFSDFKVRSARRNNATDKSRIAAVVAAIDGAVDRWSMSTQNYADVLEMFDPALP